MNRADLLQRRGFYPPPPGASPILGLECAGEVIEVAPDVTDWRVGERAMALLAGGGYAEEVVVDAGSALRVPAKLSLEEAAALPEVFLTVFSNVFQLGGLAPGGCALVHGGGSGIGTAAIRLVKARRARGSSSRPARTRSASAAARSARTSPSTTARATSWPRRSARPAAQGVDVVLDSIGAAYFEKNLAALRTGGRLVLIGLMGGAKAEVNLALLLARRLSRDRLDAAHALAGREGRDRGAASGRASGPTLEAGTLRPVVDRVLPLARAAEAHRAARGERALRQGRAARRGGLSPAGTRRRAAPATRRRYPARPSQEASMDLSYTPEEQAFRARVRAVDRGEQARRPTSIRAPRTCAPGSVRLHQAGFLGAAWPKEHGGAGLSPMEQAILNEEMARANAPAPARLDGHLVGGSGDPALRDRGAEAPLHPAAARAATTSGRPATPSRTPAATCTTRRPAPCATATTT